MYLACQTNPLKGPERSTLNFGRTLVFGVSRPGKTQSILNILISCMYRTMTVVSEIYCQNLKDKTSILSLGQIIKMCYCRIHAHATMHERYLD